MPCIVITDRAYEMLKMKADKELNGTAQLQPDGCWNVPISDQFHQIILDERFADESISQAIIRFLPTRTSGRQ